MANMRKAKLCTWTVALTCVMVVCLGLASCGSVGTNRGRSYCRSISTALDQAFCSQQKTSFIPSGRGPAQSELALLVSMPLA